MRITALLPALGAVATAVVVSVASPVTATAAAGPSQCGSGTTGPAGYAYAGHQAATVAHGIRATITPLVRPKISNGHVAGWVGVGGRAQGPNGETMWLQAGVAGIPGLGLVAYAEITRPGADPKFVELIPDVQPGQRVSVAVLEVAGRPDYWRVWLNGSPVTEPILLRGSSERWKPIATAESFMGGSSSCNGFGFRFERVGVAGSKGGSWRTFVPGSRYLDRGFSVRVLTPVQQGQRALATEAVKPFAFEASAPFGV